MGRKKLVRDKDMELKIVEMLSNGSGWKDIMKETKLSSYQYYQQVQALKAGEKAKTTEHLVAIFIRRGLIK